MGTTTAAKGGDNLGFSGHKHFKGDKVVAFCDHRHCNVIALLLLLAIVASHRCCSSIAPSDPHRQAYRTRG